MCRKLPELIEFMAFENGNIDLKDKCHLKYLSNKCSFNALKFAKVTVRV